MIPKQFDYETGVVIASGPSLCDADVRYCQGRARVCVVNDNYKIAPWADVLYAADGPWWDAHGGAADFLGQKWTQDVHAAKRFGLNYVACKYLPGISHDPALLHAGFNSGFQAVNLMFLMGCRKIVLLGFDMKLGKNGQKHWFGNHPKQLNRAFDAGKWARCMDKVARRYEKAGVEIINASRETALLEYRRASIGDCL